MSKQNKIQLYINPVNATTAELYANHKTFHPGDSGLDLYILNDIEFKPGETKIVDLGIKTEVRKYELDDIKFQNLSYYLYPRSSISKTPLRLANSVGIIDSGYRGTLKAALTYNLDFDTLHRILAVGSLDCFPPYILKKGSRVVQLCLGDLSEFNEIILSDNLSETLRGEGGFGSTGAVN